MLAYFHLRTVVRMTLILICLLNTGVGGLFDRWLGRPTYLAYKIFLNFFKHPTFPSRHSRAREDKMAIRKGTAMTKSVRIENADTSDKMVKVYVEVQKDDGTWERLAEPQKLTYPTAMITQMIWKQRRLVIEEG